MEHSWYHFRCRIGRHRFAPMAVCSWFCIACHRGERIHRLLGLASRQPEHGYEHAQVDGGVVIDLADETDGNASSLLPLRLKAALLGLAHRLLALIVQVR